MLKWNYGGFGASVLHFPAYNKYFKWAAITPIKAGVMNIITLSPKRDQRAGYGARRRLAHEQTERCRESVKGNKVKSQERCWGVHQQWAKGSVLEAGCSEKSPGTFRETGLLHLATLHLASSWELVRLALPLLSTTIFPATIYQTPLRL